MNDARDAPARLLDELDACVYPAWGMELEWDRERALEIIRKRCVPRELGEPAVKALDEIAAYTGCPEWDYPGQVVRDVEHHCIPRKRVEKALEFHRRSPGQNDDTIRLLEELLDGDPS